MYLYSVVVVLLFTFRVTIFIELSICVFVLCVSYMVVYGILNVFL